VSNVLYSRDNPELVTEYPFFRDGMTCEEFEKEQKAYAEHLDNGGMPYNYIPVT